MVKHSAGNKLVSRLTFVEELAYIGCLWSVLLIVAVRSVSLLFVNKSTAVVSLL